MKKRLGIAATGALLTATLLGGAGYASGGFGGGNNVTRCAQLTARIGELGGLESAAIRLGDTRQAARDAAEITRLSAQRAAHC